MELLPSFIRAFKRTLREGIGQVFDARFESLPPTSK